jgi:hypothetical protein
MRVGSDLTRVRDERAHGGISASGRLRHSGPPVNMPICSYLVLAVFVEKMFFQGPYDPSTAGKT